ncbi:EFR1 family ferrodoxin [Eubacterium limosum]|uniref:EFR1 family ferrodoxin n=1 Tax=Eubacterium limosum TaxID=1736 RepID=A0ABT5UME7_EUBLI|nr:EFR1 family ferrodoxin [Eubacterium limosum]MCB6568113.1 EFR1 family ferrodoxin [Eubacterium limosum]MDE1470100.1 EFR1 family ferrodoxin [Eubacterium limosum]
MKFNRVWAVYFSATGTTKRLVTAVADNLSQKFGGSCESFDFTLPEERKAPKSFEADDLVVFGTPVYAGRVPNVLLKYLMTLEGNGAAAVPLVLYGNRDYDDALIELRDILEKTGFHTLTAGAFIGEHSFSDVLAAGRPDGQDMEKAQIFAELTYEKAAAITNIQDTSPVAVKGTPAPYRGYYQPRDRKGTPVDIRKVKPLTDDTCTDCKLCFEVCPMGSISHDDVRIYTGICIKCGACIKKCPVHARYYDDAAYLYHKHELEEGLKRRAEPEWFL